MCPQPRPGKPVSVYASILEDTDIPTWEQAIEDYQQMDILLGLRRHLKLESMPGMALKLACCRLRTWNASMSMASNWCISA
jgi:hypothetical protein